MTNESLTKDPLAGVPRYIMHKGHKARVIGYDSDTKKFEVIDHNDQRRTLLRSQFVFLRDPKKTK